MSLTDTAMLPAAPGVVALVRRRLASKEREFVAAPQTNCTHHHPAAAPGTGLWGMLVPFFLFVKDTLSICKLGYIYLVLKSVGEWRYRHQYTEGFRISTGVSSKNNNDKNLLQLRKSFDKVWRQRPSLFMLPLPHKHGDSHLLETIANVITSVPFVFIGLQAPRNKVATRMYADSIIGVGVVSSLYHTSRGDARKIFRWGDYAMISASALCLTRALRTENTNGLIVASALLLPFKPSLVTAIHTGLTEATFYRRVSADTRLRGVHALHTASSLLGCALFVADGMLPHTPFIHAVWHLAAAVGVATYNKLLD